MNLKWEVFLDFLLLSCFELDKMGLNFFSVIELLQSYILTEKSIYLFIYLFNVYLFVALNSPLILCGLGIFIFLIWLSNFP